MTESTARDQNEHLLVLKGGDGADLEPLQRLFERLVERPTSHRLNINASMSDFKQRYPRDLTNHALVVLSQSTGTRQDQDVIDSAQWCLDNFVPVFFVCDTSQFGFDQQAPDILRPINGMPYSNASEMNEVGNRILHLIGFDERERSIFVSYRRADGNLMANDLRHALLDRGWDVFLDRYSIPPAVDFQRQLDRDLDGRSLVLVVESPTIKASDWVEHEIAFAKQRGIAIHSLQLPGVSDEQTVKVIDPDRRSKINYARFEEREGDETPAGLVDVVESLQRAHTSALRARRNKMLADVHATLERAGFRTEQVDEWAVSGVRHGSRRAVVLAIPRAPRPADLRQVQNLRGQRGSRGGCDAWVVHPLIDPDPALVSLLRWLRKGKPIRVCSLTDLKKDFLS